MNHPEVRITKYRKTITRTMPAITMMTHETAPCGTGAFLDLGLTGLNFAIKEHGSTALPGGM